APGARALLGALAAVQVESDDRLFGWAPRPGILALGARAARSAVRSAGCQEAESDPEQRGRPYATRDLGKVRASPTAAPPCRGPPTRHSRCGSGRGGLLLAAGARP